MVLWLTWEEPYPGLPMTTVQTLLITSSWANRCMTGRKMKCIECTAILMAYAREGPFIVISIGQIRGNSTMRVTGVVFRIIILVRILHNLWGLKNL